MEHPQKTSPKKRRGPPSRAAVLRWVLAAIACSGVLAYFPSVCSAVFLALLVLLVPIGPLEKRLAQFAPRLRRVRTAAIAALFLLAACIAPRETAEPAAPERVIEAGIQEETKTPAADEPAQEQPSEPDIPDTEPEPETPADIDPESETPTSAEPEVPSPAAPDPAPAEPSPSPAQSETVYIPRRARNTTERAAATCKRARFPSHSTTRRQRVTPPASPAADKTTQKDPSDGKFPVRRVFGSIGTKSAA